MATSVTAYSLGVGRGAVQVRCSDGHSAAGGYLGYLGYADQDAGPFRRFDLVYMNADGTLSQYPRMWKLSEAVELIKRYDLRATECVFPDGTRWMLAAERAANMAAGTGSYSVNMMSTAPWVGKSPEPTYSKTTSTSSWLTPRQWLTRRVGEVVELGRLRIPKGNTDPACTDSYGTDYARGFITSGAA